MRTYPKKTDKSDMDELKELNCEPWMVDLLKLNPSYVFWGPYEDYMITDPKRKGWDSSLKEQNWKEGPLELNDYNECVNFYFELERNKKKCPCCDGSGYHSDARWVADSFYEHSSPFLNEQEYSRQVRNILGGFTYEDPDTTPLKQACYPEPSVLNKYSPEFREFCKEMSRGGGWNNKITEDEMILLLQEGRLHWPDGEKYDWNKKTKTWHKLVKNPNHNPDKKYNSKTNPFLIVEEVSSNPVLLSLAEVNKTGGRGAFGHDAINRWVLVQARCKRFGIPVDCPDCKGSGKLYTEEKGHVNLILWVLHPRKGASRGIEYKYIQKDDIPSIMKFLKQAAKRNAQRFEKIT